jgi:hypothetical protein
MMAKSKKLKTVKTLDSVETKNPIVIANKAEDELINIPEVGKAESITTVPADENERTVVGLASAEYLQKSGWRLIDVSRSGFNKIYKFRKAN